ncbi:asparagine synthetase B family protein [Emticicia soli]|uniref:asparagine synthase (glutamine-hydrolyzing) n=1 Tax=Emticicia soli TaxID=2027878 RepID=A0ABW5J1T9_9BACT
MSAIFGIINKNKVLVKLTDINTMSQKLMHHAIDGKDIYSAENVMLGYHHLMTHATQEEEKMPFVYEEYIVIADARIDNRVNLSVLLNIRKKQEDISNALLLIESFKKWGENCVEHLEGEFSFMIYHKSTGSFFAASDHIGHRSFFYHDSPERFIFASEIKAVLAVKSSPHYFNDDFIVKCFVRNYNGYTYIKDIHALKGGHSLVYNPHKGLRQQKYWTAQIPGKYRFQSLTQWGECLRELMTEAIEQRISTNQAVGVKLSGGLDSSFITSLISQILLKKNKSFTAFSSVLDENDPNKANDESFYINLLGKHLPNMEQVFICPPKHIGPFHNLKRLFEEADGAFNPFHYLDTTFLEAAQSRNIRLLFNGYGGDHAISNTRRSYLYQLTKGMEFGEIFRILKLLKKGYGYSVLQLVRSDILAYTPFYIFLKKTLKKKSDDNTDYFSPEIEKKIVDFDRTYSLDLKTTLLDAMNNGNLGRDHHEVYYRDAHFGLRKTTPFLDKKLLEFYLDVPEKVLFDNGLRRGLIREAMRGLVPDEIVWRKYKKAYSPDFQDRTGALEIWRNKLLYAPEYESTRVYMNKKNIKAHLHKGDINATMSVLIFVFIQWLKDHNIE